MLEQSKKKPKAWNGEWMGNEREGQLVNKQKKGLSNVTLFSSHSRTIDFLESLNSVMNGLNIIALTPASLFKQRAGLQETAAALLGNEK
jgi:hypothetical protein